MDDQKGIFEHNPNDDSDKLIKTWKSIEYYPRWNAMIYSKTRNTLYSARGKHIKPDNVSYQDLKFELV